MAEELLQPGEHRVIPLPQIHVVVSELAIAVEGSGRLEDAFRNRLGAVDDYPGHRHLEVWKDDRRPGRYLMVSWWDSATSFHQYMRSEEHRASHARIPTEPARPQAVRVDRFSLLST
ncbi:MAG: antibiotic biosynthesis monooxygenase family protein [Acidimicrobiales bacterium]